MSRVVFLRHGESTANAGGTLSGWEDVPLTAQGELQAQEAGRRMAGSALDRVFSSDLQRARRTAELALSAWSEATGRPAPPIQLLPALRERNLGDWQGIRIAELRENGGMLTLLGWGGGPPGGESHHDLARRVVTGLAALPPSPGCTLLVAHGGVIRTLLGLLDGLDREMIGRNRIANCDPCVREIEEDRWQRILEEL